MALQDYLAKMSDIQKSILTYINDEESPEVKFLNLLQIFDNLEIRNNKHYLKSVLHIVSNIADNHHRGPHFFDKIQKIITNLKIYMKKYFSNFSIFNLFKSNKRILLFLIKEQIITIDKTILSIITDDFECEISFYPEYLFDEIKPFINDELIKEITEKLPKNYEEKKMIGENDSYICELIRKDLIDDFVNFVKKEKLQLTSKIEKSIFETNSFLIDKNPSLIEYAAFFGSINILKYLQENKVELTPSLWLYAIHNNNIDIVHIVEDNHVEPKEKGYIDCINESIKCHHNEIANYIEKKYVSKNGQNSVNLFSQCLKHYNISLIQNDQVNASSFFELCQYDYFLLADMISKEKDINVNIYFISISTISKTSISITFKNEYFNFI